MACYTQSFNDTSFVKRNKIWDPSETLGIINTDPGYQRITCIGYAPSQGRRCRNPINQSNRSHITRILDDISYLHPSDPNVLSQLRTIAGPALCVRYHQNQYQNVIQEWCNRLRCAYESTNQELSSQVFLINDMLKKLMEQMAHLEKRMDNLESRCERYGSQTYQRQNCIPKKKRRDVEFDDWASEQIYDGNGSDDGWLNIKEERLQRERADKERLQKQQRQEKERRDKAHRERERLERERLERERLKKEREDRQRLDAQRKAREEAESREREKAAYKERVRRQAQRMREGRERSQAEKELREKEEWSKIWSKYEERWVHLRSSGLAGKRIRDAVPWPVKSGLYSDVRASNVEEFFLNVVPKEMNMAKIMRKECQKWHPDSRNRWIGALKLTEVDEMMVDMICRVVTGLLGSSSGKSREFL